MIGFGQSVGRFASNNPTPAPKTPSRATTLAPHSCAPLLLDNKEVTYLEMIAERRDKGLHEDQLQEHWAKLSQASQGNILSSCSCI